MSVCDTPTGFAFDSPHAALCELLASLQPVAATHSDLHEAFGRVLSKSATADRDSPPSDVSAMDGYAVRSKQVEPSGAALEVTQEVLIGRPAPPMPGDGCLKISTGACVPAGCDGVIPREQVEEGDGRITIPPGLGFTAGQHIRRRGENASAGDTVVPAGCVVTPTVSAALAAFGHARAPVYRPVRVRLFTTGNELLPVDSRPEPWQIRDSNAATLLAGLKNKPWVDAAQPEHLGDDRESIGDTLREAAKYTDLILTTGGVSMGDRDYLKPALLDIGGRIIYHKLPIRPGKPGLAGLLPGVTPPGRVVPVLALPGNPVAVSVGLPLFIGPVARALAGFAQPIAPRPRVHLTNPPTKPHGLWRYLPARLTVHGEAELLSTRGSGDLVGAALVDGFVEFPPGETGPGPWVFYDVA